MDCKNSKTFVKKTEKLCSLKDVHFSPTFLSDSLRLSLQEHAYPADELMPLTCRGRVRGQEPSRGDVDDALGKWVLTKGITWHLKVLKS